MSTETGATPIGLTASNGAPFAFHLLAKPTGAICNLDCAYCFFLSKEMLYPGSRFRMTDEMLERYIRQLLKAHRSPEVFVAWQGGEPTLMGLDFFQHSIEYQKKYCGPETRIINTIQTNGTLLDDSWGAFFKENDFLVGISIDGPRAMHDAYRWDKGGHGTFDQVMRGLAFLQNHKVEHNILTTIHRANAQQPLAVYRFLRDECRTQFIQFIPIVERAVPAHIGEVNSISAARSADRRSWRNRPLYTQEGDQVSDRSVTAEQYGQFLIDVFEGWVRRDVGRVYVQMFDVALANWCGAPPGLCIHAETCGGAPALEHNGDLYSCDHFVEPDYRLGNIGEQSVLELVTSEKQRRFGEYKRDTLPQYCLRCDVRFACHGGCPKDRFIQTPDGEAGLNYLCAGYKRFFRHVDQPMRIMAELLRREQAPAQIMGIYAAEDARLQQAFGRTGRNDPCPCGSGRKFKRCHRLSD